ncbi:hypothetical protein ERO13_A07G181800v2 [Gossypium hirsutum]|uniref:Receptor-like protein kinase FERONIA n=1 Tax=Gossypium hirsutum TaxID=3635 RepID=A0A1U8P6Z5_GOSHI|nr:receptor-like protein kinase FERONIA [Gossypium hirsutum]KAG4192825.1 hypothetical protein ERO13_A07G181800v2 [Gossypium hirsutum]
MHLLSLPLCFSLAMKIPTKTTFSPQNSFPCLFFFFFSQYLVVPVIADFNVTPYYPIENITIDCGSPSTNALSSDGRSWVGDSNGKFSPIEPQNNKNKSLATEAVPPQPSFVDNVPYSTARLSYSQFTYSIPLTSGPKFIRLHFYPTSYLSFDDPSKKAFFSVQVGPFTLLRNFNASLHAVPNVPLIKEFCTNVEGQRLNLTFTPSPDITHSYAFINAIEVVSMPINLYYTPEIDDDGVPFLGQAQGSLYTLGNNTALEMMYRVDVGGREIPPGEDTGIFRGWLKDDAYLTIAKPSALPVNTSINLTFSSIPLYSAPRDVYITARTMGTNKTQNYNYYLTWEFPVDSGFNYFVRLHFCEFQIEITKEGDRVFEILLANLTAETEADVISWSGGNGIPVYRDYMVSIGKNGNQKQQNLSIALHPSPAWRTHYSDAILNGLEIFKLSNGFVLASPDPVPINQKENSPPTSTMHNNNKAVFGIVGGVISGFVVLSLLCFFVYRQKMRVKDTSSSKGVSQWSQFYGKGVPVSTKCGGSSLPSDLCRYFSLSEIKRATNNFDNVFIIGVGGFGNVYKGFIDGGETQVAIKRLNPESQQGAHEFRTEIEMLSQLRHLHLVSLIGYCNDDGEMILVYDYMANGTLRDHLYNTKNPPLSWKQRLEICVGAAQGLQYLHSGAKHTIIHRDVKTTNILLDENWVAKVSDFGLSRVGPTNMSQTHVSTVVKGSFGYLDPEYYRRGQLTEKSDIYSFGVVLCEILCARPPISRSAEKNKVSLATWAQECYRNGTLYNIIDPFLKGKIAPECLKKFTEVAMSCLHDDGIQRPSLDAVVWGLQFALQLQESAEEDPLKPNASGGIEEDMDEFKTYEMEDESGEVFSSIGDHVMNSKSSTTFSLTTSDEQSFCIKDSDKYSSKAVFSEIRNPQGR